MKWEKEFDSLWDLLEPEVCTRVKTHNTQTLEDYTMLESVDVKNFIKALLEDQKKEIIDMIEKERADMSIKENNDSVQYWRGYGHAIDDIIDLIK